jgi:hypothetical protein
MEPVCSMLPELSGDYRVTTEEIAAFRRDGHVRLRAVAETAEIAAYRPAILDARSRFGPTPTPLDQRDTYGKAFLKGMNLWEKDERVAQFVLSTRFAKLAADLLGVDGVRIYHDQALLKEPGGGITPWHQDQHYWPLDTDHTRHNVDASDRRVARDGYNAVRVRISSSGLPWRYPHQRRLRIRVRTLHTIRGILHCSWLPNGRG